MEMTTNLEMRPFPTEGRIERLLVVSNRFGRNVGKDDVEESFVGFFLNIRIVLRGYHQSEVVGDFPKDGDAAKSKREDETSQLEL